LGRFLNSAVIRSQGPAKTTRRLAEVSLLLEGNDFEAIAKTTGSDVATIKQELHHSATRIKATTPKPTLEKILQDATLQSEVE
jgi:DNA-binding NarL/FixJ family response regulator